VSALLVAAVLVTTGAWAARPAPSLSADGLESMRLSDEVSGVLLQVSGETPAKSEVRAMLDDYFLKQLKAQPGAATYAFFKTEKGHFVAVSPNDQLAPTMKGLNTIALALSKKPEVQQVVTWLHPGAKNVTLENEVVWRFVSGKKQGSKLFRWRDDPAYFDWIDGNLTDTQMALRRATGYPLTELAAELGIPGRWFFEYPNELFNLADGEWPRDVGANLAMISLYLPAATVVEMQQHAETSKLSVSKVLQQALAKAEETKELGREPTQSQKAPWDDANSSSSKVKTRRADFFLERRLFGEANQVAIDDNVSLTYVFSWAWRRAHPFSKR
jgi:hypothetical protein